MDSLPEDTHNSPNKNEMNEERDDINEGHLSLPKSKGKHVKRHSIHGITEEVNVVKPHQEIEQLTQEEKRFLLAVERGDVILVKKILEDENLAPCRREGCLNINCVDSLGRSALLMAIDNGNLEMLILLIRYDVNTNDALLYAISEQFVEAVEVLLDNAERGNKNSGPSIWECRPIDTTIFSPDITPLVLAAHRDNYEIIKILLDKGATIAVPHDIKCGCDECVKSHDEDSLQYSRSRINAYRALSSPSLISLSSKDPILTAFQLSWELRRLSNLEHEFKKDYQELKQKCEDFTISLLDHTRTSHELEMLLNYNSKLDSKNKDKKITLSRLKLAIKLKQKEFVAHPSVHQLLASIWYDGVPGFRRKNIFLQAFQIILIGIMFPYYSVAYIVAPKTSCGSTLRKPFIKFICHASSYFFFLFLLILSSLDYNKQIIGNQSLTNMSSYIIAYRNENVTWPVNIGTIPQFDYVYYGIPKTTIVEYFILIWVIGYIWSEMKQYWNLGLKEYIKDMWNIVDVITLSLYVATFSLRVYVYTTHNGTTNRRRHWDDFHPILVSEALFSTANIFSSLKLVYIFSINPYLGPLQIGLSRMVFDIAKFFFLYILVLFSFSCGLNQLLGTYADWQGVVCKLSNDTQITDEDICRFEEYKKFSNLFETVQTLYWSAFGVIELKNFRLEGIREFTKFWARLTFGAFCVISLVVLLNLLIAMMNHSYDLIYGRADIEWKFARSKLWISYFEDGGTVPVPFNIIPTPKALRYFWNWITRKRGSKLEIKTLHMRQHSINEYMFQMAMRSLIRRYVTTVQRRTGERTGATEDDMNELKHLVESFRGELFEVFKNSGFNVDIPSISDAGGVIRKRNRMKEKERRLMKGFNIGPSKLLTKSLELDNVRSNAIPEMSEKSSFSSIRKSKKDGKRDKKFFRSQSENRMFNTTEMVERKAQPTTRRSAPVFEVVTVHEKNTRS